MNSLCEGRESKLKFRPPDWPVKVLSADRELKPKSSRKSPSGDQEYKPSSKSISGGDIIDYDKSLN